MHVSTDTVERVEIIEEVNDCKHVGCFISAVCNMQHRKETLNNGRNDTLFQQTRQRLEINYSSNKTKLKHNKCNVRSVLLYASEASRTNKKIESRFRSVEGHCETPILKICCEQRGTNVEIFNRTNINKNTMEIYGYVLRMGKIILHPEQEREADRSVQGEGLWSRIGKCQEMHGMSSAGLPNTVS